MEDIAQCTNHPNLQAQGQCCLCHQYFCEDCLLDDASLVFCLDHYQEYQSREWVALKKVVSTSETPEAGIDLYKLKDRLWAEEKVFCYIKTSYDLADDSDLIQSHVTLYIDKGYYQTLEVD